MSDRPRRGAPAARSAQTDYYSPQLRTALIFTGTGTAGAYHAGVLRALHEAGVKVDVVAGRGVGAVSALFAAIDASPRLWEDKGFWRSPGVRELYPWRAALQLAVLAVAASLVIVAVPILAVALGLIVFPIDFVLRMLGLGGAGLVGGYLEFARAAFASGALPTWLPRIVVLLLGGVLAFAAASAWIDRGRRREHGPWWWTVLRPPLSADTAVAHCWRMLWDAVRGAAHVRQPAPLELARRYVELLSDNLGQPGFRELLIAAHDVDARRDLVFCLVAEPRRRDLIRRATTAEAEARRAEVLDLAGLSREHLVDAIAGALAVPVATEFHPLSFAPDSYWRGETHRICDRIGGVSRVMAELAALGVEQAIVVTAAPVHPGAHALTAPRRDPRGRLGEYVQSAEATALGDALRGEGGGIERTFTIQPGHNPIGPFDFGGGYDDRSDRAMRLDELLTRGYEDAYHQFIEPVVAASGDRVGQGVP